MNGRWTGWAAGLAAALLIVTTAAGAGRQGTPDATPLVELDRPLDLAAMALDAGDLPVDGVDRVSEEYYLDLAQMTAAWSPYVPAEELAATGLRRAYESASWPPVEGTMIRSYIEEFATADGAMAGFALLEDEARFLPSLAPGSTVEDRPAPGVGEAPGEMTVGTVRYLNGRAVVHIDLTFRVDRLLVGVYIEAPVAQPAPDEALALALAVKLEERVRAVLAGQAPAGIDPTLPALTLAPIAAAGAFVSLEGYLGADEALGDNARVTGVLPTYRSGYARTFAGDHSFSALSTLATVAVFRFDSPAQARAALAVAAWLPRGAPLPVLAWGTVDPPAIAGVDAVAALTHPFGGDDSYRIALTVGDLLAVVTVADQLEAEAIALALAEQQAACLTGDGPCAAALPPVLLPDA